MRLLVVGGAGYIGSHMCKILAEYGHAVTVCDDLSTGHREAIQWGPHVKCSLSDLSALEQIFKKTSFDAVMHFAASSIVAASVEDPLSYYRNNVSATLSLLEAMHRHGVEKLVFSSTAAIYGSPEQPLIDEMHPQNPINPYGRSKLFAEQILADLGKINQLNSVSLRYFNAAGADFSGVIGESHNPETHLIPKILRMAAGEDNNVRLFGQDYSTPDGTCIRDYVHVNDLCLAHLSALDYLSHKRGFNAFNLGNGQGYSVREVISSAEEVVGRKLRIPGGDRRKGDPAYLVASSEKASKELNWHPRHPDIRQIIESAWKWHRDPKF